MFLRKVLITFTHSDALDKPIQFLKNAAEFQVRSVVGWGGDTATISLFNLSPDEIKLLQKRKENVQLFVSIQAGYADELLASGVVKRDKEGDGSSIGGGNIPTVFSGIVSNVVGFKQVPESVTQIFCVSKATYNSTLKLKLRPIKAGTTLRAAIKSMSADYGFDTVSAYGITTDVLNTPLKRGRVMYGVFASEMQQLLGEYGLVYRIGTAEIAIMPSTFGTQDAVLAMANNRKTIFLTPEDVIGNPIAGISMFDVTTPLRPDIHPGMIIDISQLAGSNPLANGVVAPANMEGLYYNETLLSYAMSTQYFVKELTHVGQTHGDIFRTYIKGSYSNEAGVSLTNNWTEWYTSSKSD